MVEQPKGKTFRLKKSILHQGIGYTIFFSIVIGLYLWLALAMGPAAEAAKISIAVLGLVVFGPMLFGALCLWRAYYVERLTIDGRLITLRSLTQSHHFDLSEIQSLAWSTYPRGGSLRMELPGSKARLSLHGYAPHDRQAIIALLHTIVPRPRQQNWPKFCHRIAIPLRDGYFPDTQAPSLEQQQRDAKRRQQIRTIVLIVTMSGILSIPLLVELGFDKLTAIIIGNTLLLVGIFGFLPFLPRAKTKWSTEDEALAMQLWDEGELAAADELVEE